MKKIEAQKNARKVTKEILAPEVWKFIDVKKFARSIECELALEAAVEHIVSHGDSTVTTPWLQAFAKTEYFETTVNYFSGNAGLIFVVHAGIVSCARTNVAVPVYKHFLDFHVDSKARTLEVLYGVGVKLKNHNTPPYLDAMDSRKRLPGSYENGRRN